jgi:hypothetical protein
MEIGTNGQRYKGTMGIKDNGTRDKEIKGQWDKWTKTRQRDNVYSV